MILHCTALTFWRACNWDLEAEPPTGSRGRTPGQGSGVRGSKALKLKGHHGSGKFAWFSESAQSSNDYVNGLISAFSQVAYDKMFTGTSFPRFPARMHSCIYLQSPTLNYEFTIQRLCCFHDYWGPFAWERFDGYVLRTWRLLLRVENCFAVIRGRDLLLHGMHLWVQFDSDRCMGGSRPNENDFCNT